jgi:TatD DNase family protein
MSLVSSSWFDSHIHFSSFQNADRDRLIEGSVAKNIMGRVMAGYDSHDWDKQLSINSKNTFKCFGLHPWQVLTRAPEEVEKEMLRLGQLLPTADFLGETGLDGFRAKTQEQRDFLEKVFRRHLELNVNFRKPLVLHVVKDHSQAINLLKTYSYSGFVHGFSGSWEVARGYLDIGYLISVGRGVYQNGYKSLKQAVVKIPLDCLLLESDGVGDSTSGPEDVVDIYMKVVKAVCELKNISQEELQEATFRNINRVLPKES